MQLLLSWTKFELYHRALVLLCNVLILAEDHSPPHKLKQLCNLHYKDSSVKT